MLYWSITPLIEYDTKSIAPNIGISFGIITRSSIYWISYIPEKRCTILIFRIFKIGEKLTPVTILSETIGEECLILRIYRITIVEVTRNRGISISLPTKILITDSARECSPSKQSINSTVSCESKKFGSSQCAQLCTSIYKHSIL